MAASKVSRMVVLGLISIQVHRSIRTAACDHVNSHPHILPALKTFHLSPTHIQERSVQSWSSYLNSCWKNVEWWMNVLSRSLFLVSTFAPALLSAPVFLVVPYIENDSWSRWWWRQFRSCVQNGGPCCIKFAQWAATRSDLLSQHVRDQLTELQSQLRITNLSEITAMLDRELGLQWRDHFELGRVSLCGEESKIDIIGAGCIAQVVKGHMKNGDPIAVKICHPAIRRFIETDISIAKLLCGLVEVVPGAKTLSTLEMVEEFERLMLNQLDLTVEASNMDKFRENFRDVRGIVFPKPVRPFVTENVLVESFAEGVLISDMIQSDVETRKALASLGLHAILKMVFTDNFIHADLHPGNIICRRVQNPSNSSSLWPWRSPEYELCLIDTGLVAELSPQNRTNFLDLFLAVARNNGKLAGELMIERSVNGTCADPQSFIAEMEEVVSAVHRHGLDLNKISVRELLTRVLIACYVNQVKLEARFVSVVLAIGVLEGLGRSLDPNVNLMAAAVPYIVKAALEEAKARKG